MRKLLATFIALFATSTFATPPQNKIEFERCGDYASSPSSGTSIVCIGKVERSLNDYLCFGNSGRKSCGMAKVTKSGLTRKFTTANWTRNLKSSKDMDFVEYGVFELTVTELPSGLFQGSYPDGTGGTVTFMMDLPLP